MNRVKSTLLAAGILLAMAFTFGCSDDTSSGGNSGGGLVTSSSSSRGSSSSGGGNSVVPCPNTSTTPVNAEGIGSVTCDGRTYKTVKIGEQVWMAENLNYNAEGSKCGGNGIRLSDANTSTCDTYGRLYNWSTTMIIPSSYDTTIYNPSSGTKYRGVCPSGWHIPSNTDWNILMKFVNPSCTDNSSCAGAGTKLKSANGWFSSSSVPAGTDDYGFSAMPGGSGDSDGRFYVTGGSGDWWSSSEGTNSYAYSMGMHYFDEDAHLGISRKDNLYSIRCVQD